MKVKLEKPTGIHTEAYRSLLKVYRTGTTLNYNISELNGGATYNTSKFKIQIEAYNDKVPDTEIVYGDVDCDSGTKWNVNITETGIDSLKLVVFIPKKSEIGEFTIKLFWKHLVVNDSKVLIVFNPWDEGGDTYIESEEQRLEYVMNNQTMIYVGSSDHIGSKFWSVDQFEQETIKVLLIMLQRIPKKQRQRIPLLVRELTALVNSNDDRGILVGNWSGSYEDGYSPLYWNGSGKIFRKYLKHKNSVKYGQCWVYAALLNSILRCAGIPSRIVTNFQSLHDSDGTLDYEKYIDKDYKWLNYMSSDSVWNFHVWNECNTSRSDLDKKFNGWQIIDATPQERSEIGGKMTCGPSPLSAIKDAHLEILYDTKFVFAEVRGSIIVKMFDGTSSKTLYTIPDSIGKFISTKAVGKWEREDVTQYYKYENESELNNITRRHADNIRSDKMLPTDTVDISMNRGSSKLNVGQDMDLELSVKNVDDNHGNMVVACHLVTFDGKVIHKIFTESYTLKKGAPVEKIHINSSEISKKTIPDYLTVNVEVWTLWGNGKTHYACKKFPLETPSLEIRCPQPLVVGAIEIVSFNISNPFTFKMKQVRVAISCLGIEKSKENKMIIEEIGPGDAVAVEFPVLPIKKGHFLLTAMASNFKPDNSIVYKEVIYININ